MSQRFAAELRASLPEVDAFIGLDQVRELGAIIERVVAGGADPEPESMEPGSRRLNFVTAAPDLHSGLGHAALSPHPGAQRLPENRRRLQSPVQLLRHPADARPASQPPARFGPRGDAPPRRRRREGNQSDQPGHDLLRNGFVDREGRAAPAGRFVARSDAGGACCARSRKSRAISGCACSTRIRRIGAMS